MEKLCCNCEYRDTSINELPCDACIGKNKFIDVASILSDAAESAEDAIHFITSNDESDPTGAKASDPGAKLDSGKVRYSLIPTRPLWWLAKLYTRGAKKYSANGWKEVPNGQERYLDALMRHLELFRSGEWLDSETNCPHLISVAWNCFAIVWMKEYNKGLPD